jgi:hypothetical protein
MVAVFQAARDFVMSINEPSEYEERREEIVRKFNRAREENQLLIAKHEDIHEYLSNLSSEEFKLASFSRRLKSNNNDEDLLRQKSELFEWFKEQEINGVEETFLPLDRFGCSPDETL